MTALIRRAGVRDGPAVAAIYRPAVADSAVSFELEPPDGAEMGRRIASVCARTPWLVARPWARP
jgi:phosphinothricin acetyltransferase